MVNVGYFLKFKSIISGNTLISISNTNINEVLEFGKSYLNVSSLAVFSVFLAAVFMGGSMFFLELHYIMKRYYILLSF